MFVVATTRRNASPSLILELLSRVARVVKDYCGALTEDALRKNAILVYELLDEMLDHGYAQSTNTDSLKHRVHNEPAAMAPRASRDVEKTHRANVSNVANPIAATVFAGVSAAQSWVQEAVESIKAFALMLGEGFAPIYMDVLKLLFARLQPPELAQVPAPTPPDVNRYSRMSSCV